MKFAGTRFVHRVCSGEMPEEHLSEVVFEIGSFTIPE